MSETSGREEEIAFGELCEGQNLVYCTVLWLRLCCVVVSAASVREKIHPESIPGTCLEP